MLLSRRVVSAAIAARAVSPRTTQSLARFYATETAAPETPAAASPTKTTYAAKKPAAVVKPKPKPVFAAATGASATRAVSTNNRSAIPQQPAPYEPKITSHQYAAADDTSSPVVTDWTNSFYGISAKPVTEEQYKVLMTPVDINDIEVKPDGVIYLPEIKYRRRLNEAFGPMGWGLIPKSEIVVGNAIVTREYALIVDGRFVSQAQGENGYFSPEQLPSAVEGCKSNALMRCCKDLGIHSELWDPHFVRWYRKAHMEEVWVEHTVTKKKRTFWYKKGEVDVAYPYKLTR
ncbi:hypothetical protein E4U55_002483 [Claviceps digitariae]|nr:hypothetical protein E4U55_002483 [Claviceps digitariae]